MGLGTSCPGSAWQFFDIKTEEPQVAIMIEKQKVIFLLDSGACLSVLPFSPGPRSKYKIIVQGISAQPLEHYFTQPLASPGVTSTSVTLSLWSLKL
jgi:hypothetical protein